MPEKTAPFNGRSQFRGTVARAQAMVKQPTDGFRARPQERVALTRQDYFSFSAAKAFEEMLNSGLELSSRPVAQRRKDYIN